MNRLVHSIVALLVCASALFAADNAARRDVIVKWRALPLNLDAALLPGFESRIAAMHPALQHAPRDGSGLDRISVIELVSGGDALRLVNALKSDPRVEYAEVRPERHTCGEPARGGWDNVLDGVPNDPFYSQQWDLRQIEAEAAWDITRGDPAVVIAVVDVGVDFSHPELEHARWSNVVEIGGVAGVDDDGNGYVDDFYGWDFMDGDGDPTPNPRNDTEAHGTHVSGIAAAVRNNYRGIAGLAPNCKIMGVRAGGSNEIFYGYEGIYYACRAGARVINCSWGGYGDSPYERDVIRYVQEQGCVVVSSAGNDHTPQTQYPAGIDGVISVASSGVGDLTSSFTNYGRWIQISAPGEFMLSTVINADGSPGYALWRGTSMAAPLVSAACALVASHLPALEGAAIAERVISASDPIDARNPDRSGLLGLGRLNVWRALSDSVGGVRLAGIRYSEIGGDGNGHIQGGERAQLQIGILNDLEPLTSVVGQITSQDTTITLTNPVFLYGAVPAGGPFWNSTPVSVDLPFDMLRGPVLNLTLDWRGAQGRLIGRATTTVYLDSTFTVPDNGYLALGFAEHGSLGYDDFVHDRHVGPGLRIAPRQNALYHGSFVLAADGSVSDNTAGDPDNLREDWTAVTDSFARLVPSTRAGIEARADFQDYTAPQSLLALVHAAALMWRETGLNGLTVLEYSLVNRSANPWNTAYAGLYLDWDLGPADQNVAAFDAASQILYFRQLAPGYPMIGLAPLSDPWGCLYVADNAAEIATNQWTDARKWTIMQQGAPPQIPAGPRDQSLLAMAGPFTLGAQQSRTFAYSMVVGQTLDDLSRLADSARAHYMPAPAQKPDAPLESQHRRAGLYPNPLAAGAALHLEIPDAQRATVRFYDILGRQVAVMTDVASGALQPGTLHGATGLLFYQIASPAGTTTGKLLILR